MSKSGTLSYEAGYRLAQRGIGTSVWIGVGGDPVKGPRFADLVPFYAADAQTGALLIIGEIGGHDEEEFAAALKAQRFRQAGVRADRGTHLAGGRRDGTRRRAHLRQPRPLRRQAAPRSTTPARRSLRRSTKWSKGSAPASHSSCADPWSMLPGRVHAPSHRYGFPCPSKKQLQSLIRIVIICITEFCNCLNTRR